MQIFENNSFNTFLFNNNSHVKNYVVIPVSTTNIAVYNAYDTKLQLLPSTHYSQVSIDGQIYTTQAELMSVLSPLLFYKASGGTEGGGSITNQNNVGKITEYPLLNGTGAITTSEVASFLNNYVIPFYVSETNTPVLFSFNRQENGITKKYIFIFLKGKGSWGGQSGATPVYSSYFRLLSVLTLTGEDIENGDNNQIYDLGIIPDGDFVTIANASDDEFDFSDSSQSYYFTYTQDDVLFFNLFIGTNGVYAGESGNTFDENDFVGITNSNIQPVPDLQQVTEIDNTTTYPIVTYGGGYKVARHNTGEDYTDANGRVIRINYPTNELTEESVIYDIPAKTLNDIFAMNSDINGMTITANQATSEIYLNNAEGNVIATLSVGFLNNEGTTFFYNSATEKLELKNDSGEVLSEVPVSAFVANLIQSVNFNGSTPYVLEFKDASGNVVDSVTFTISNIQGLQSALDGKISTSHPANGISGTDIAKWNILKVSADYNNPSSSIGYGGGNSINDLPKGTYTAILSTNISDQPFTSVGGFISIGATGVGQGTQILGSRTGNELWFRPYSNTYGSWYRLWNNGDFTSTDIDNWDASWNSQKNDAIYVNGGDGTDANVEFSGAGGHKFSYGSTLWLANRAWSSYGGLITFKRNDINAHGLQFQYDVGHLNPSGGRLAFRTGGDTIKPWKTIWNDGDFTSTDISNWDTAYSWGDFRTFGLGESLLPVTDLTSSNVNVNRFFRFLSSANGSGGFAGGAVSIRYDNSPTTSFIGANGSYAFVGYKNGENVSPQFYKLWDTRNFSQTDVINWNTAYSWGNHTGLYLPLSGASLTNSIGDIVTIDGSGVLKKRTASQIVDDGLTGNSTDYVKANGTFSTFSTDVRGTLLNGLSNTTTSITSSDSVLSAFGKAQGQIDDINLVKLPLKANLASPNFTGTPTAPTASNGTSTTQIATTAFVQNAIGSGVINQGGNTFGTDVTIGTNDTYDVVMKRNNLEMARFGYNNLRLRNNSQITTTTAGKSIYLSDTNFLYTNTVTGTTAAHRFVAAGTSTGSIMQFVNGSTVKATVEKDGQVVGSPAVYDNAFVTLGQLNENIILTASTTLVSSAINIHVTNDSGNECTCVLPAANVSTGKTIHLYNIATDLLIIESESTADIFTPAATLSDFSMSFGEYYKLYSNGIFWMRTQG